MGPRLAPAVGGNNRTDITGKNDSDQPATNSTIGHDASPGSSIISCTSPLGCTMTPSHADINCGTLLPGQSCNGSVTEQISRSLPNGSSIYEHVLGQRRSTDFGPDGGDRQRQLHRVERSAGSGSNHAFLGKRQQRSIRLHVHPSVWVSKSERRERAD